MGVGCAGCAGAGKVRARGARKSATMQGARAREMRADFMQGRIAGRMEKWRGKGGFRSAPGSSGDPVKTLLVDEGEEFEGCSGRLLLAALPLRNEGMRDIQMPGENGLTDGRFAADTGDLPRGERLDRREAHGIELVHGLLAHNARIVKIMRQYVNGPQDVALVSTLRT
jgi:hypothetical protein